MVGVSELLLVRHGESEGNVAAAEANAAGAEEIAVPARDADVGLSELGRLQAAAVGARLATLAAMERPDVVVCSPYVRARETARLTCEAAGLAIPIGIDERLRDRELGVLDRLTEAGVAARYPDEHARRRWQGKFYHRPAGGESWADVVLRLRPWLVDADAALAGKRVLAVSHDVVIVLLRYVCAGLDEKAVLELARSTPVRNAAVTRYVRDSDGCWQILAYDDVEHLRAAGYRSPSTEVHAMSTPELVTPELLRRWPLPDPTGTKNSRAVVVIGVLPPRPAAWPWQDWQASASAPERFSSPSRARSPRHLHRPSLRLVCCHSQRLPEARSAVGRRPKRCGPRSPQRTRC